MSEQQAMAAFMAADPQFNPPNPVTYQLGTLAPGPGQSAEGPTGETVWAFTWPACPEVMGSTFNHSQPTNTANSVCTEWLFLHADTGKMIDEESQE